MGLAAQKQYGVTNPYDPGQEAYGFGAMMTDDLNKYHGNLAKALAAYDGDTHVDSDVRKYGDNWGQHAKPETQKYVKTVAGRMGLKIDITNQTGANVAIIANAAALN